MKVRMKVQILGTRDLVAWPPPGGEVDLPEREAVKLCDAGLATPVVEPDADVEKRATKRAASKSTKSSD